MLGAVTQIYNPIYAGGRDGRIRVQGWFITEKGRPDMKNKLKQNGLRHSSSDPELIIQSKKKRKQNSKLSDTGNVLKYNIFYG